MSWIFRNLPLKQIHFRSFLFIKTVISEMEARNWAVGKKGFSPAPWEVPLVSTFHLSVHFMKLLIQLGPVTLDQQGCFFFTIDLADRNQISL